MSYSRCGFEGSDDINIFPLAAGHRWPVMASSTRGSLVHPKRSVPSTEDRRYDPVPFIVEVASPVAPIETRSQA